MNKELLEEIKELIKKEEFDINLNQNEEKIIEKFKNKADWGWISIFSKISESFIREFKDNVVWYLISSYQNLSEPFIREFKDNVVWVRINENKKIDQSIKSKFSEEINKELLIRELNQ